MKTLTITIKAATVATLLAISSFYAQATEAFDLILPTEATEAMANPAPEETFQTKALGAPVIKVVSPTVDAGALESPVDIEMTFESPDNAVINMQSLRIFYVMMIKKDVTKRILEHATLNDTSLVAKGAKLPKGNHKFIVEIQDDKKRKTREKFSVRVTNQ